MHPSHIRAEVVALKSHALFDRRDDVPLHMYSVIAVTEDNRTIDTALYFDDGTEPDSVIGKIYNIPFTG